MFSENILATFILWFLARWQCA